MKVGIYKQHLGGLHRSYLERYEEILHFNGIRSVWLDANKPNFWDEVAQLDLFIYQWEHYDTPRQIAPSIIPIIEYEMKIPCYPNWQTSWHYDDKIKQYYLLKQHGFPVIESYIFWDKTEARKWLNTARLPVVFKLKGGAASKNVILIHSRSNGNRLIARMFGQGIKSGQILDRNSLHLKFMNPYKKVRRFGGNLLRKIKGTYEPLFWQTDKNYVLFQKFLPNNTFDTRVSVIGSRAFAFRRFNRQGDFRASGSGKIDYDVKKIDMRAVQIAFEISKKFHFQSMAYDFLLNEQGNFEIAEISYTYVDKAVYDCSGFWDKDLNWHEGHFWPQYLQLVDALKMPHLKQPKLK